MATALEHYNLACDYWEANQRDAAIAELKQVLELEPNHRDAIFNLGCMHGAIGHYEDALEEFNLLVGMNPNDAVTYKHIGKLFRQKASSSHCRADWIAAQNALEQSLLFDPNDANALDNLAVVLLELEQYIEAAKTSKAAAKLSPKDKRIAYNQSAIGGQILRRLLFKGKWKEARQAWKALC